MRVDLTTNQTGNRNLNEMPTKILPHVSIPIENESELWQKTWNLYINAARSPMINDPKRQALLQLAEDAKEQYAKIIKPIKIQQKASSQAISTSSKWKVKIPERIYNKNFISCLTILRCFVVIIVILIIVTQFMPSLFVLRHYPNYAIRSRRCCIENPFVNLSTLELETEPTEFEKPNAFYEAFDIPSPIVTGETISINPEVQDRFKHNSILYILLCLLFVIFGFIISRLPVIRQILIYVCYIPRRLYRWIFTHSQTIRLPLMHKIEKVVLLDSMTQHSHLSRSFEDNLLVYSSIHDCFHDLASDHPQDYILFLSFTDFEVHSLELERLSNVSLCIFYEDNDHSHPHISKTKYHIRFIFPKACLRVSVRNTVIQNYLKQAYTYRLEGLEREADENYLAASRECHILANELEQQSTTAGGREPGEVLLHDREDMNDPILNMIHL